jgi:saccharopine dehydrogenase-like NADP-dependent oxidoreductase
MGRFAVQTALAFDFIDKIIIADLNREKAEKFARKCGPKTGFAQIDVDNKKALLDLLSETDVVLNTVGPYFRFGVQVLEACIAAGCHYLDINDDWEPTLEMLELDEKAREAEVSAIVGMGVSPGISNLLAVKAIAELDQVRDVYTGWNIADATTEPPEGGDSLNRMNAPDYRPSAAIVHGIHQFTGKIRVYRDGRFVDERPIKRQKIDYPALGRGAAWTIGHPEPVTLPRYYPDVQNSFNVFVAPRKNVNQIRFLSWLVNLRLVSVRKAAIMIEKDEINKQAREKEPFDWRYTVPAGEVPLPPLFAFARGFHAGQPAAVAATIQSAPPGKMGGITGVPLAVGLLLLANRKITRKGVFAPEAGIDPDAFFDELAPLCEPPMSGINDLVLVTRSWEKADPELFK